MTQPNFGESGTGGDLNGDSSPHVVVVGQDGVPVGTARVPGEEEVEHAESLGDLVEEPAKVMRIGTMIKQLLEDTARNAPTGGRDDSRGFGLIDPAAAIKASGRLKPEGLQAASYGEKYFGSGPDAAKSDDSTSSWAAPLAGSLGGVLLVAAVVLWRGRRRRFDDF